MHCSGVHAVPEVVILSDSDEDDDSVREVCASSVSSATASVSILHERPLSPSAFTDPSPVSAAHRSVNSTRRPTCGIDVNGASIHSSRLHSATRFAQHHEDIIAVKHLVLAEQVQRRPLQQPIQNATPTRTFLPYDSVIVTPSTSELRPRQASIERQAVAALSRHHISSTVPAKNGSTVPSVQQDSPQISLQRQRIIEQQQPSLRRTSSRVVSSPQKAPPSSAPQRPRVLPSPQPVAKPPQAQHRAASAQPTQKSRPLNRGSGFLNAFCYESFDPKAPPFEPQTFNARFKCCYERCRKILSNNVSLMFHVWTHVVCGRPSEGEDSLSRLELASLCPQCLTIFPTPFAMQAHYVDVHSENPSTATCNVCEITVEQDSHLNLHGEDDAPYHCRKCRYRTSIRIHLLDHFVRFHSNTRTLLCPFCLLTFNVANHYSNSSVVTCNPFVEHMHQHRTSKQIRCWSCALKFIRQSDRKMHKRDHTRRNPKWVSRSCFNYKHPRRKGRKVWHSLPIRRCVECGEVVSDLAEHIRQIRTCVRCGFTTGCDHEYTHHRAVGCTIKRSGFTRGRLLRYSVVCAQCGRTSADSETILPHISSCSGGSALVHEAEYDAADELSTAQEQQEVEHFTLREREMPRDRGNWFPAVARVVQEQNLPELEKKIRNLFAQVDDDDDFLDASKRKLVSANGEVLRREIEDVMQCMEEFSQEASQGVASAILD
uniref:C2H2-type domain-containing protein n=2 Tax=Parascaris univalens TaxID=6257 RepID=A0A915B2X7_PARUN